MRHCKRAARALLAGLLLISLAACGTAGAPEPSPDAAPTGSAAATPAPAPTPSPTPAPTPTPEPEPSPTPEEMPEPTPPPDPHGSAAIGTLTGNDRLDEAVKEILDGITSMDDPLEDRLKAAYLWVNDNFTYKNMAVDLSDGFTDELISELAEYAVDRRRGSCEHCAAVLYVLFDRLTPDVHPIMVEGDRLDLGTHAWGLHVWVILETDGVFRHYDVLYGRNHLHGALNAFAITDADLDAGDDRTWDRERYPACN